MLFTRTRHSEYQNCDSQPSKPYGTKREAQQYSRRELSETTGPLSILNRRRILVLADDENLRYSARDLGCKISYRFLAERLQAASRRCLLHTFFSHDPDDYRRTDYFSARGWTPHGYIIETVESWRGVERVANSDNLILLTAGHLAGRVKCDVVVIASGDGRLVTDTARFVMECMKRVEVVTLSVPHSTSARLDATRNDAITANIELGADCLTPATSVRQQTRYARKVR